MRSTLRTITNTTATWEYYKLPKGATAFAFYSGPGGELHYFPSKPRFTRGRAAAGMGHGANMQQSAMCDTARSPGVKWFVINSRLTSGNPSEPAYFSLKTEVNGVSRDGGAQGVARGRLRSHILQ